MKPLFTHQKESCRWLWECMRPGGGLVLTDEPGLGKTATALSLGRELHRRQEIRRVLVVAPKRLIIDVWPDEAQEWWTEARVQVFWSPRVKASLTLDQAAQIVLVPKDTFRLCADKTLHSSDFDLIIVDESTMLKGRTTQIAKVLLRWARQIARRVAMSGTPAPNSELEYWAQVDFAHPNALGGFYHWRSLWFTPGQLKLRFRGRDVPPKWRLKAGGRERFAQSLERWVKGHRKQDCLDLPAKTVIPLRVTLGAQEAAAYAELAAQESLTLGDQEIRLSDALAVLQKLRQVTSGFAYSDNRTHELGSTKLDLAEEMLTETLAGRPVVCVYNFVAEGERLLARLGDSARMMKSDLPESEKSAILRNWKAGEFLHLLIHPRSCGHGLTLTRASEMLWLSPTWSLEEWLQTQDRLHRISQTERVSIYVLLARGTVDEQIHGVCTGKFQAAEAIKSLLTNSQTCENLT